MAFGDYNITEMGSVDGGILNTAYDGYKLDNYSTFEEGLLVGRFAKIDTGSLDNLDNSATPVIAGVVLKSETNAIESGETYTKIGDGAVHQLDVCSFGLVTVEVVTGDTPAFLGNVYAWNDVATPADYGKATTTALNNTQVTGYFNREIKAGVWEILIKI